MIKLRGHHLICLHFFRNGPEPLRTKVLEVIQRAEQGEEIEVVEGPDEVCTSCPYFKNGVCTFTENAEEEIREMDKKALELLNLKPGTKVKWSDLKTKLQTDKNIVRTWVEEYCSTCDFKETCEKEYSKYL